MWQVARKRAYTLLELLTVVVIIGILFSLLLPAVQMARETANRLSCSNNERQIALALHAHESTYNVLPATWSVARDNTFMLYWQSRTLGFIGQTHLLAQVQLEVQNGTHIYFNSNRRVAVAGFECPSNPDRGSLIRTDIGFLFAFTDYCGVAGSIRDDGIFPLEVRTTKSHGTFFNEITDGLSNTLLFGERPPSDFNEGYGAWTGGQDSTGASTYLNGTEINFDGDFLIRCGAKTELGYQNGKRGGRCDWTHHWSFHPNGANFARADGSVFFLSYATDRSLLSELASKR